MADKHIEEQVHTAACTNIHTHDCESPAIKSFRGPRSREFSYPSFLPATVRYKHRSRFSVAKFRRAHSYRDSEFRVQERSSKCSINFKQTINSLKKKKKNIQQSATDKRTPTTIEFVSRRTVANVRAIGKHRRAGV